MRVLVAVAALVLAGAASIPAASTEGAVTRWHGEIIGLAECHAFRRSPADVELAVTVDDEFHRRGLGGELLDIVIERAERHGATNVHASVLAENRPMLELLHKIAPYAHKELERGVIDLVFPLPIIRRDVQRV